MKRNTNKSVGGHTGCSEGYNFKNYKPSLHGLQRQGREQIHSRLEKLTPSLRQCNFSSGVMAGSVKLDKRVNSRQLLPYLEYTRIRLESSEKNVVMETERRECETEPPSCCAETARDPARLKEAIEADRYWEKYLAKNKTVVAHSFQGQFKNTVICGRCSHVSVSFEPFMYLSVPLPRAVERQVEVVVVLE